MRILLVRTSALGDVVHALPVVAALRRHLPEARIAWVVEQAFASLLSERGDIDEVIPVRLRAWRRSPLSRQHRRELGGALSAMRRFRADLALDLMGNHKAGVLVALSGAKRRLGAPREQRREPSSALWVAETAQLSGEHVVDRTLSLLSALGLPTEPADFAAERIFPSALADGASGGVLLHAGAGWGNKTIPAATAAWLAREIGRRWALPVTIAAGPGEGQLAQDIATRSDGAATAALDVTLADFAGRSRASRLVIGGDTGPLHLAHAVGARVLMAMGPTDPARHGPYRAPERAIHQQLPCSGCYCRFDEPKACITSIRRAAWLDSLENALG